MGGLLNGLRGMMPPADSIAGARGAIDALPGIMHAMGRLPAVLRDLPPAPVIMGAASRMVADAIATELIRRGPSPGFLAACAAVGVDDAHAGELHAELVREVGR